MKPFWKQFISPPQPSAISDYALEIGSYSDVGRTRSINQDQLGYVRFANDQTVLTMVADGMGGHRAGEVASQVAVATFQRLFVGQFSDSNDYREILVNSTIAANREIYQLAQDFPEYQGMGTTLVALAIINGYAYYTNTGDSRLYCLRKNDYRQLSEDHTLVADMVNKGLLTPAAAENHPDKHIITSALGTHGKLKISCPNQPLAIEMGDCFLLCSDGLYDLVKDDEMRQTLVANSAQQACEQLVGLANARGGLDNISVLIVKILAKPISARRVPITRA